MSKSLYRQPSHPPNHHFTLVLEAFTSLLLAGYLFYLVCNSTRPQQSHLPFIPLTILLLVIVTASVHLSISEVALARQGIVQGHCLVPILATALLFHTSVNRIAARTSQQQQQQQQQQLLYNFAAVAGLLLCSAVSLIGVGIPSLCPRRRTHTPEKVQQNVRTAMISTALGIVCVFVFLLGISSARFYTYCLAIYITINTFLPKIFPKSFTHGECSMIAMCVTLLWVDTSLLVFSAGVDVLLPSSVHAYVTTTETQTFSTMYWPTTLKNTMNSKISGSGSGSGRDDTIEVLIECGMAGSFLLLSVLVPVLMGSMRDATAMATATATRTMQADDPTNRKVVRKEVRSANPMYFYSTLMVGILIIFVGTYYVLNQTNPILCLLLYIQQEIRHVYYLMYWSVTLIVGIVCIGTPNDSGNSSSSSSGSGSESGCCHRMPQIIHRKLFHALALVLFVPPLWNGDYLFMGLSIAIALALSVVIECTRIGRVAP